MSHLARAYASAATSPHLLADAASGHLVLPFRRGRSATWLKHRARGYEDLSGEVHIAGRDSAGREIVEPPLAMSQADIAARVLAGLADPWPEDTTIQMAARVAVEPQPDAEQGGHYRWGLEYIASRWRIANAGLFGIESLSASVDGFYADAGAGTLYLGWRLNAGTGEAPSGIPDPLDMDTAVAVTGDATIPIVSARTPATSFEIYAWVAGGLPPQGPYDRRYTVDGHYKYGAGFYAKVSGLVIVDY